jgi:hypothetical protein
VYLVTEACGSFGTLGSRQSAITGRNIVASWNDVSNKVVRLNFSEDFLNALVQDFCIAAQCLPFGKPLGGLASSRCAIWTGMGSLFTVTAEARLIVTTPDMHPASLLHAAQRQL